MDDYEKIIELKKLIDAEYSYLIDGLTKPIEFMNKLVVEVHEVWDEMIKRPVA